MKTFEITFTNNPESKIYSANLVLAENEEQAIAYFSTLGKYEIVGCTETLSTPKPGQPVHKVPEGWTVPETELQKNTREYIEEKAEQIENADCSERMHYWFIGASEVLNFLYRNDLISINKWTEYDKKIDLAHERYYEKAKKDFENAHKRIFD